MLQELATETPKARTESGAARRSKLSAHYDALLRRIQAAGAKPATSQSIGVMSCAQGAGVSTVALNVAITAAQSDCGSVLLVDADINHAPGREVMKSTPALGLANALSDAAEPLDCVEASQYENLSIVAGRGTTQHSLSSISPTRFAELIDEYKRHFNLIVIDMPAPTQLNGSVGIASQLDGVVLVLEAERADGRAAVRTKQQLVEAGANVLGVVFNKRRQHVPDWLYRLL